MVNEATPLLELNKELLAMQSDYSSKEKEYKEYCATANARMKKIKSDISLYKNSVDANKVNYAMSILNLEFPTKKDYYTEKRTYYPIYQSLVSAAKTDLISGVNKLKREYIGQKYYGAFDQRCDCEYGYGPSHGSIYQRIGLRNPKKELTDTDIECCLYLLENLDSIVASKNLA
ncbi:MAG: hypothetical protein WCR36_06355 [Bacteroidaceae bacterium]